MVNLPISMTRECPSCFSTETCLDPVQSAISPAEMLEWEEIKEMFIGLRPQQTFFTYRRCAKCNLAYNTIYFSQTQLDELYSFMPDNLMGEKENVSSRTQFGYANQILKYTDKIEVYLELGPDIGLVAKRLSSEIKRAKAMLVEPNLAVHEKLAKNTSHFQNVLIVQHLSDVSLNLEEKPDLIVGIHVLDHLPEPALTLQNLHQLSSKNAKLCLVVHNERSILRMLLRKKWPPFCLQHPQLFEPNTIKNILESNGWKPISIRGTRNYYSLQNILRMGFSVLKIPTFFIRLIPNLVIPIYLGNIMVVAEKN